MKLKSIQELYLWTIIELTCKIDKFRNFAKKTWWNIRYYKLRSRFKSTVNYEIKHRDKVAKVFAEPLKIPSNPSEDRWNDNPSSQQNIHMSITLPSKQKTN